MTIKIKDIISFYMNKMKDSSNSTFWEWFYLLSIMLIYMNKENGEMDITEVEKVILTILTSIHEIIPNIREEMGLEE